jgi:hypothetical protein
MLVARYLTTLDPIIAQHIKLDDDATNLAIHTNPLRRLRNPPYRPFKRQKIGFISTHPFDICRVRAKRAGKEWPEKKKGKEGHAHTHTHTHTPHTHTYAHTHTHIRTHTHTHTYTHINTHTHTHAHARALTHTHPHTHTYAYMRIPIHAHTHVYTRRGG